MVWKGAADGNFSTKTALAFINDCALDDSSYRWIWKLVTYPKIKFFIWLIVTNRIPTTHHLHNRSIDMSIVCAQCSLDVETSFHALRDCPKIASLWEAFKISYMDTSDLDQTIVSWIQRNYCDKGNSKVAGIPWNCLFPFILWGVWIERNAIVHNQRHNPRD